MAEMKDRPNTALVVVDVQNDVVVNAYQRDEVIANMNTLVVKARQEDVPVIWVQHNSEELPVDSQAWAYVPELQRTDSEPVVHKEYGDSFEATDLEDQLERLSVGKLVVVGAQTDACVRSTLHGAFTRGYDTVLVSDAHTTDDYSEYGMPSAGDVIAHTNFYWRQQTAPGRQAEVQTTAEVNF